jgi:PKD repeat protein
MGKFEGYPMSSKLLPPLINVPVTVLNPVVIVSGALAGSKVELFEDGVSLNRSDIADVNGVAQVGLSGLTLKAHACLTAKQTGGTEISDPSPEVEIMDVPVQIPPLAFLSMVHEWMDAVAVGGVIPYALVELFDANNNLVGLNGADGTITSLPYQKPGPIPQGVTLTARQTIVYQGQNLPGPLVPSIKVQPNPLKDRPLPAPDILDWLRTCDTSVPVGGIVDGATTQLHRPPHIDNYDFLSNAINAETSPLVENEKVAVGQSFSRMGLQSPQSSQPVLPYPLPAPLILEPVCVDAETITITKLRPGSTVILYSGRQTGNIMEQAGPWIATAKSTTQIFPLPADLQENMSGPVEFLFAYQEDCQGVISPSANPAHADLIRLSTVPPAPGLGPLYECARVVHVSNLEPGTSVGLTSDQADFPILAAPTATYAPDVDIQLFRPLRAKEIVTAQVSPCGSGQGSSASTAVLPLQSLNAPQVHNPTRAWQTSVLVEKCVPGAHVYVFVNDVCYGHADAVTDTVHVPVGSLLQGGYVRALQSLCLQISGLSEPVGITLGQVKLSQTPFPIYTNPNPQTVTITARDWDDDHLVDMKISTWPAKVPVAATNKPLTKLFPYFYNPANETFVLEAPGYLETLLNFNVSDPKPIANFFYWPASPYANQTVNFVDFSSGPITSWDWDFGQNPKSTSSAMNPQHSFVAGKFIVTLTVNGPGGATSKQDTIWVSYPPYQGPPPQGFDEVEIFYCPASINLPRPQHTTLYIYVADLTMNGIFGSPKTLQQGYVGGLGNYAGVCGPGQGSGSESVQLTDGHQFYIVCVDPDLCNGANDPTNSACVAFQGYFLGKKGGGTAEIVVN